MNRSDPANLPCSEKKFITNFPCKLRLKIFPSPWGAGAPPGYTYALALTFALASPLYHQEHWDPDRDDFNNLMGLFCAEIPLTDPISFYTDNETNCEKCPLLQCRRIREMRMICKI